MLKRGITHENALLAWFLDVPAQGRPQATSRSALGPGRQAGAQLGFVDAFPVKWQGPGLNASSNNAATETLEIAHHGFKEM